MTEDYGYQDDPDRCDTEIEKCAGTMDAPAYLTAMGQADWSAEKRFIENEIANKELTEAEDSKHRIVHQGSGENNGRVADNTRSTSGSTGTGDYSSFLTTKRISAPPTGIEPGPVTAGMFPFQGAVSQWGLRRGRAAFFEDCGMGKTIQELEWGRQISEHNRKPVLLLAPLAVSYQTKREADKFGIEAMVTAGEVHRGINITNYEKLKHFRPEDFNGIICDESSILKGFDGKLRRSITDFAKKIPYRLLASATPAPNDVMEMGMQAEFFDIMSHQEMLATFFTHDGADTAKWRLKGHAEKDYWRWLASWAVCIQNPADIGYPDERFTLPPIHFHEHVIESKSTLGYLFPMEARTLQDRQRARKDSIHERVAKCAEIVNGSKEPFLIWCNLNEEGNALEKAIEGCVQVQGKDDPQFKEDALLGFAWGLIPRLVSKPRIAGFGLNLQICSNMAFVGLSDSYEQVYQAIRRCWRFGQTREVNVHIIVADTEGAVLRNIKRKEAQAQKMAAGMVEHMREICTANVRGQQRERVDYLDSKEMVIPAWLQAHG